MNTIVIPSLSIAYDAINKDYSLLQVQGIWWVHLPARLTEPLVLPAIHSLHTCDKPCAHRRSRLLIEMISGAVCKPAVDVYFYPSKAQLDRIDLKVEELQPKTDVELICNYNLQVRGGLTVDSRQWILLLALRKIFELRFSDPVISFECNQLRLSHLVDVDENRKLMKFPIPS